MATTTFKLDPSMEEDPEKIPEFIINKKAIQRSIHTSTTDSPCEPATEPIDPNTVSKESEVVVPAGARIKTSLRRHQYKVLNQWEGTVVSDPPYAEHFTATVRDLTNPSFPQEQTDFDLEEVSPADRFLVMPGAIFYWFIGYKTDRSGQTEKVSFLRFRRLPIWTEKKLQDVERKAEAFQQLLNAPD